MQSVDNPSPLDVVAIMTAPDGYNRARDGARLLPPDLCGTPENQKAAMRLARIVVRQLAALEAAESTLFMEDRNLYDIWRHMALVRALTAERAALAILEGSVS
jgi:hypothetical protein